MKAGFQASQGDVIVVMMADRSDEPKLLFLPGYSPNLNPIERLWKFVKKEALASRPLPGCEAFTGTMDDCLNNLQANEASRC